MTLPPGVLLAPIPADVDELCNANIEAGLLDDVVPTVLSPMKPSKSHGTFLPQFHHSEKVQVSARPVSFKRLPCEPCRAEQASRLSAMTTPRDSALTEISFQPRATKPAKRAI